MRTEQSSLAWILTPADHAKLRLPGTDRARASADTLDMAMGAARRVGVTRVADITRLDTIGIPTFQAIRPTSRTVAVSQGKGVTPELAKLSAVMESVELWHAERPLRPAATATPRELAGHLAYSVHDLPPSPPSLLHDDLPLDWALARSLADGSETYVPLEVVGLSLVRRTGWNAPAFFASTNGLASGNTLVESVLHALYEVIERDAMTRAVTGGTKGVRVDPRSSGSPVAEDLCEKMARAEVSLEVRWVESPTGLSCFLAQVTSDDYPYGFFGFGCHLSSEIALTRAITEAAQSRLAYVSGARDDLRSDIEDGQGAARRPAPSGPGLDFAGTVPELPGHESLADDLAFVIGRAAAAFAHEPLVVDLTVPEIGVPVVKVVVPGSRVCPEVL